MAITKLTGTLIKSGSIPTVALGGGVVTSSAQTVSNIASQAISPGSLTVGGLSSIQQVTELLVSKSGATGTVTHDLSTSAVFYHSSIAANFTVNLTNVPTTDARTIVTTLVLNQGVTGYYPSAFQIDGVGQTIRWIGNAVPTPSSNAIDVVTFSLIRAGATWYVLGQLAQFA